MIFSLGKFDNHCFKILHILFYKQIVTIWSLQTKLLMSSYMSNLFLSLEIGGLQLRFKLERKEIGTVLKYSECPNETQLWHKLFHLILPSKFIPACIFEILTIVTDICKHKQNKCHANYIHAKPNVRCYAKHFVKSNIQGVFFNWPSPKKF